MGVPVLASAELRLVDSPFIRFKIICVAAENCGMYGRAADEALDRAGEVDLAAFGTGIVLVSGTLSLPSPSGSEAPLELEAIS